MTRQNRRGFLAGSVGTAAGLAVAGTYAWGAEDATVPSDTINLGVIGCGARASAITPSFLKQPGVRLTAVCDVNSKHAKQFQQRFGDDKVTVYHDFRKLLEDKNIDAVIIATQAHWHVLITIAACQAGKDVYVEKPLSNFIGEGKFAIEAAKKYNRIVQIGTQQRSRKHYHQAVKRIQDGELGNISQVKIWDYLNWSPGRGTPGDCDPPPELDWDFYVGPSEYEPYNPNSYFNYGYDWVKVSGGGHQVAWGVHHFDILLWAMGVKYPVAVSAMGGKYAFNDNWDWPTTITGILEFGPGPVAKDGFVLQYDMRLGCRRVTRAHAKCFLGTEGSMTLDRGRFSIVEEASKENRNPADSLINPQKEVLAQDDELHHTEVFFENVRNRTQPFANTETGHYATNLGHLMNLSWQLGRTIRWDGEKDQAIDDPEANALINRKYRAPWKLEV